MAAEAPVRIAIIGAGPLGIEAALYARYLGYDAIVFERAKVGEHLSKASQDSLPTPAGKNRTSLGIAALEAQDSSFQLPPSTDAETADTFLNSYLLPLAGSDLLVTCIRPLHSVIRIERTELSETEDSGSDPELIVEGEEDEYEIEYAPFLLTVKLADGSELTSLAEIVIDASGFAADANSHPAQYPRENIEMIPSGLTNPLLAAGHRCSGLMTEEPNLYHLGLTLSGSSAPITLPEGHDQIRQIFSVIGDRESLNLYETFQRK